jgi:hypothetical protein
MLLFYLRSYQESINIPELKNLSPGFVDPVFIFEGNAGEIRLEAGLLLNGVDIARNIFGA